MYESKLSEFQFAKRIIFHEYPGAMLLLVLNELIGAALVLIGLGTVIPFLSGLLGGSGELPGPLGEFLVALGISGWSSIQTLTFLLGLMFLRILLDGVRLYVAGWMGVHLNRTMKERMNNSMISADWERFSTLDHGRYMQCMVAESSLARGAVIDLAAALAYGILTSLLLLWMILYSFEAAIVFVICGVFLL